MPRPYTDLSNLPGLGCRVDARCVSLQGVVSIIVTGRTIVPLEVFTNRARRASPLQRCAPDKTGTACRWRFMGAVSFVCVTMIGDNLRHLWFGIPPVSNVRSQQLGSMVVHLEVFTSWARHASPLHRCAPYKAGTVCRWRSLGAVSFACATMIGDNLRHLWFGIAPCPTFAVNHRGRWSFTWRSLPTGRGMPRPYTDLLLTRPVQCAGGVPWARFHSSARDHNR